MFTAMTPENPELSRLDDLAGPQVLNVRIADPEIGAPAALRFPGLNVSRIEVVRAEIEILFVFLRPNVIKSFLFVTDAAAK
jgi:hypothetical protein